MAEEENNVLIIDDDITVRKLLKHHLKANKFKIYEAESAEQGFDYLNNYNIDLVLCDVTLGAMDGFTFCKKVRENENHRLIPFIFVTAKNTYEDKTRALDVGGDDIITKPFDVDELILKVKALKKRSHIYKLYGVKKNLTRTFQKNHFKILLVDDDPTLLQTLKHNLDKAGFECNVANNANEAFEVLNTFLPDIIISDIQMPNMNGFEFRERILEQTKLRSIPFVFLTVKSGEQEILEGYEHDITDYVFKGDGAKVVVAKVKAILTNLSRERQKVISELHQAANSLQTKVVPEGQPDFKGYIINHWHQPFEGVPGGDFIDYFILDDEHLAIILGDVMGKKWGAWYFAFAYAGYIRSSLRAVLKSSREYSPAVIINEVNKSVYEDAKISEVFSTLSVVILDNKNFTARYTGAGDLPLFYKNFTQNSVSKINSKGMLLGFSPDGGYEDIVIDLHKSDAIILTTDGIIETRNKDNKQFGTSSLVDCIKSASQELGELEFIKQKIDNFSNGYYEDDVSLITIKVK